MKKIITIGMLAIMPIFSFASGNIEKSVLEKSELVINDKNDLFKNENISTASVEFQKNILTNIKIKYFDANNYPKEEIQDLYVSTISLGLNEAADYLYHNPNTKIDINGYNFNGVTPLMAAAMAPLKGGNVEYAKKLIDLGADINKGTKNTEITPISIAANVNNYKVLSLLIVNGALFMQKDKLDYRPIDYATKNNSIESALILREALKVKLNTIKKK